MGDASRQFELARPLWLAGLIVLPALVYYWRRTLVHFPRRQRLLSLVARTLLVVLVVLALCSPRMSGTGDRVHVVAVVDTSLSVSPQMPSGKLAEFREEAVKHRTAHGFTALWFARETGPWHFPEDGVLEDIAPDRHATDIARAIAAARAAIPANRVGHVVLISDGHQTTGDALSAAKVAGVPVSTVPLDTCDPEVWVSHVVAPPRVRLGESFHVEVVVQSTHEDQCTLQLLRGPDAVLKERKRLVRGENRIAIAQTASQDAAVAFTARIEDCKDTLAENNQAGCVVQVAPKPRVLLVEGRPVLAQPLTDALKRENIEVQALAPQDPKMPGRSADFRLYDLLVLANIHAASLGEERMKAVRDYVADGGSLLVVGGDQTLTAGGFGGKALEEALPVLCVPNPKKDKPPLAMVLVIDCSKSMNDPSGATKQPKIDLAKQGARRAVEILASQDQVGILAFEDQSEWIVPLHAAADKEKVLARIDTIVAEGSTNMHPAMGRAYLALREAHADLKHMIVLTDGICAPGDFEGLTREIAAAGISVSTVGVGDEPARPLLQGIADRAKGHAYFVDDAAALPRIFETETTSAGRAGITEKPVFPKLVRSAPALRALDVSKVPTLLGYVETQARPESQVVLKSDADEPILAWWRYGKGTSAVFTSDVEPRWAAAWLQQWRAGFDRFWGQLVRQTMRPEAAENCQLSVERVRGGLNVILDAADEQGRFLNGIKAVLHATGPDRAATDIPFAQFAPGRYAAWLAATGHGTYIFQTTLTLADRAVAGPRRDYVVSYADECRVQPTNTELLRAIAEASGGKFGAQPADVFAPSGRTAPRVLQFWPYLLLASVAVFLLDLVLKRVEFRLKAQDTQEGPDQRQTPWPTTR
jgi:uncharacterized membrane protein